MRICALLPNAANRCFYDVAPVKISESPASNTAIVEHLYSFPHAVPNSIYMQVSIKGTLQSLTLRLLRWVSHLDESLVVGLVEYGFMNINCSAYIVACEVVDICL